MANTVEIEFRGRDSTGAATNSALANTRKLTSETKAMGQAMAHVGNIASALGNQQLASLSYSAGVAANAFKTMREVVNKVGLARGGIIGVALAMAGWVAQRALAERQQLVEKLEKEKEAHKSLAKSIEATAAAQKALNDRIAEGAVRGQKAEQMKADLENLSATQAARKAGVVIGDPITPLGTNPVKDAMAIKPADIAKQMEDARKLVQEHHDKQWEIYDDLFEKRKEAEEQAIQQKRIIQEEEIAFADNQAKRELESQTRAQEMETQMKLAKLEGFEQLRAIEDTEHEERLRKIAQLNLAEEQSVNMAIQSGRLRQQQLAKIDQQEFQSKKVGAERWLSTAASIAGSLSQITKKNFKLSQGLAYAEAIISTAAGVARALKEWPFPYSIAVGAAVAAAGAAQIATIASQKSPQAHGGVDYVPEDQTVLLQQGERVIKRNQNERLMEMLDGGGAGGGGQMINLSVFLDGTVLFKAMGQASRDGRLTLSARAVA
jgi:hypothetical protein